MSVPCRASTYSLSLSLSLTPPPPSLSLNKDFKFIIVKYDYAVREAHKPITATTASWPNVAYAQRPVMYQLNYGSYVRTFARIETLTFYFRIRGFIFTSSRVEYLFYKVGAKPRRIPHVMECSARRIARAKVKPSEETCVVLAVLFK